MPAGALAGVHLSRAPLIQWEHTPLCLSPCLYHFLPASLTFSLPLSLSSCPLPAAPAGLAEQRGDRDGRRPTHRVLRHPRQVHSVLLHDGRRVHRVRLLLSMRCRARPPARPALPLTAPRLHTCAGDEPGGRVHAGHPLRHPSAWPVHTRSLLIDGQTCLLLGTIMFMLQ